MKNLLPEYGFRCEFSVKIYFFSLFYSLILLGALLKQGNASADIWAQNFPVPLDGRGNILELSIEDFKEANRAGKLHTLTYPVPISGLQIPVETLDRLFAPGLKNPLLAFLQLVLRTTGRFQSQDELEEWLGLLPYPKLEGEGVFHVPFPESGRPASRMGSTTFLSQASSGQRALTYSCAACHTGQFFGHSVVGMTNRFPRANDFFLMGRDAVTALPQEAIHPIFGVSKGDVPLVQRLRKRAFSVDGVSPQFVGLDTSLAHVALSLSSRGTDPYAEFSSFYQKNPRENILRSRPADSKPSVWWNAKYKNRWLSDGSVVSGNPIFTNILWNELGRGTDLHELEDWFEGNKQAVDELTVAVFASQPLHWTQIFEDRGLDLNAARRGQGVYADFCSRCHGNFKKGWEEERFLGRDLSNLSKQELFDAAKNIAFEYHEQTPVFDVGTDPMRYLGMEGLLELNDLQISKNFGTLIVPQKGYVPPPLLGIFSRYPYLHNNSVSSLCDLLTPSSQRRKVYLARAADDEATDFDKDCVGYPSVTSKELKQAKNSEKVFDATKNGTLAIGHDEGIFMEDGQLLWNNDQRNDVLEFLKTL